MEYDRLEFLDAVEELARQTGMEVPRDTRQRNANPDSQDLYSIVDAAAQFFRKQLAASPRAQAYLDGREVDADIRARFSIGYAPDGFNALRHALGTDERRMKLLEPAGMFSRTHSATLENRRVGQRWV